MREVRPVAVLHDLDKVSSSSGTCSLARALHAGSGVCRADVLGEQHTHDANHAEGCPAGLRIGRAKHIDPCMGDNMLASVIDARMCARLFVHSSHATRCLNRCVWDIYQEELRAWHAAQVLLHNTWLAISSECYSCQLCEHGSVSQHMRGR
jgi:NAD-dependent dihydropyrimidine dehydrogenase PreA subunit